MGVDLSYHDKNVVPYENRLGCSPVNKYICWVGFHCESGFVIRDIAFKELETWKFSPIVVLCRSSERK
jgi:hypothetical protein